MERFAHVTTDSAHVNRKHEYGLHVVNAFGKWYTSLSIFSLGPSSPVLVSISSLRQYQIQMIGRILFEIPRLCA